MAGPNSQTSEEEPQSDASRLHTPTPEEFMEMQNSPEFAELRKTFRTWVFPMTVAFLAWYLLYVLLAVYATDFMSITVVGNINVGIIIGLAQIVTTFVITALYIRFANKELDPRASKIRRELQGGGI